MKLNVDAVVEGSVSRSGDKVRITAQLIDARADKHLWAKSFERSSSDVLALQAELYRVEPQLQTRPESRRSSIGSWVRRPVRKVSLQQLARLAEVRSRSTRRQSHPFHRASYSTTAMGKQPAYRARFQ